MSVKWTDELKAEIIEKYVGKDPTPENSMEIVQELAEEIEATPNGVRLILSKAGVYVSKTPKAAAEKKEGGAKSTGTRVSKEAAHEALKDAIEAASKEADMEIISKLTGKAAVYFTGLFK